LVIAVRHGMDIGGPDNEAGLSGHGKLQMTVLTECLSKLISKEQKILILSSPILRAVESAQIIEAKFGVEHQVCDALCKDEWSDGEEQMKAILALSEGADVVIVVSHYEAPSGIANAFVKSVLIKPSVVRNVGKVTVLWFLSKPVRSLRTYFF